MTSDKQLIDRTDAPSNTGSNNASTERSGSNSDSLIARAGQIMAIIIALGLVSMISSMLVSESLSGDAAQINHAGALRMQAIRISRALVSDEIYQRNTVSNEIKTFETRFNQLLTGGLTNARANPAIELQYQKILADWHKLKQANQVDPINAYDLFMSQVDQLVTLLQLESEKKVSLLRLIQGISLLSLLVIAFVVLYQLNRTIITPLKQLVKVAAEVGKGNFQLKAEYNGNNELGVLAGTINQMSSELASTYQQFEQRVDEKTKELTRTNRALQVLYLAANNLVNNKHQQSDRQIISELEPVLGFGKVTIKRNKPLQHSDLESIPLQQDSVTAACFECFQFPLEKEQQHYGFLVWQTPITQTVESWQREILQAMADIIATAIDLEQKRITEHRLIIVEERAVIARELHDSLAQSLSYLKVQMSLLTRKMQKNVEQQQISQTINDIKDGLNKAYQQLRELLTTFRLKLDDPSIETALRGTVAEFSAKCHHPIELKFLIRENLLSANQEIHVLQIVREALSNVQRHAQASHAKVIVENVDQNVQVSIIDNGVGMSATQPPAGSFGLGIMQERANSLGSQINFTSIDQKGTTVAFEFEL